MGKTLTFTGKRPKELFGYEESSRKQYTELKNVLKKEIEAFYKMGYDTFITGGAQGIDQIAFWAVHDFKQKHPEIQNIVYAPCKNQDSKWQKEGMFGQDEYQLILKKADKVHFCSEENYFEGCLLKRNHDMVKEADMVLAIYPDATWENTIQSGTAECMRYAGSQGKEIVQMTYEKDRILETIQHEKNAIVIKQTLFCTIRKNWMTDKLLRTVDSNKQDRLVPEMISETPSEAVYELYEELRDFKEVFYGLELPASSCQLLADILEERYPELIPMKEKQDKIKEEIELDEREGW